MIEVLIFALLLLFNFQLAGANVEKTIFLAPESSTVPQDASIDNLLLISLNPDRLSTRTFINASFPTTDHPKGIETWALLEGLNPGQRYEVRICWLATQPTSFWIYTHTLAEVFETPDLISSLSSYSYARHAQLSQQDIMSLGSRRFQAKTGAADSALLFLRVYAAADYFSLNKTLMQDVPPVHADIILDPYIFNVLPQSLLPTAVYLVAIAFTGWFLSGWVFRRMRDFMTNDEVDGKKNN